MNQLWLMTMIALLAANVIAQDDSDEHFLNLVRRKASDTNTRRTETDLSEEDEKMDDSSHEMGDDNVDEQDSSIDIRKRMNNKPKYAQLALEHLMQAPASTRENTKKEQCKTLKCRLQYAFESRDKDGNQEVDVSKEDPGADEPKKRCVAWTCKRRLLITREKTLSKKSEDSDSKRCMSWGCKKKRSLLRILKRDRTMTQNPERQEASDAKRSMRPNRRCLTRECKKQEEVQTANLKKKASAKCIAWNCNDEGKRTAKRSRDIDASKRIISRKPDDVLGLLGSSRDGKCRGLGCLAKRMRNDRDKDVASLKKKTKMPAGCMTWDCYGKRAAAKKEPVIDILKRIISNKNDNGLDMPGLSRDKCRGWECLKKRVVHGIQSDIPTKCLSWDCDKRRADTGEITLEKQARSTKTQGNRNGELHEKDASQYGIPDEYKDMIQRPIRRNKDTGSQRSLGKDIQDDIQ